MTDSTSSQSGRTTKDSQLSTIPVAAISNQSSESIESPLASTASGKKSVPAILNNRWFVLGAIFGAMMFLGLPLLWRCPTFSWIEKAIWTIVTLLYSYAIIWLFLWVLNWSWRQIQNSL